MSTIELEDVDQLISDENDDVRHFGAWKVSDPPPLPGQMVIALCGAIFRVKGERVDFSDPDICLECRDIAKEIWKDHLDE